MTDHQVVPFRHHRFAIADGAGRVVDDANGYGYKSEANARKAMWWKFGGGKARVSSQQASVGAYWRDKKPIMKALDEIMEANFKEWARGEVDLDEVIGEVERMFDTHLNKPMVEAYLKYGADFR